MGRPVGHPRLAREDVAFMGLEARSWIHSLSAFLRGELVAVSAPGAVRECEELGDGEYHGFVSVSEMSWWR